MEYIQYGQYTVPSSDVCVNLGAGQPNSNLLPLNEFNNALKDLSNNANSTLLQYGQIKGYYQFRKTLAEYLSKEYDKYVDPDTLLVTQGITGALTLLLSVVIKDFNNCIVFCEDPTYFIALEIFIRDFQLNIVPIRMENDGINLDELEKMIHYYEGSNKYTESYQYILYTIPMYNNPTGYTMSNEKREKLAKLANKYNNLTVIADEVYHLLNFSTETNKYYPLYYHHNNFISMGSMSKIFAPAIRLGWIQANKNVISMLEKSGQLDSGGCVNPIGCAIMERIIQNGTLYDVKEKWKQFLENNCNKMHDTLIKTFGDEIQVYKPTGGYFLWVKINVSTEVASKFMEQYKVKYHYGNKFSLSKSYKNHFRLSFSWYSNEDIEIGINRLKDLFDTFKKTNVYVLGHNGKLGKLIVNELYKSDKFVFAGELNRNIDISQIRQYNSVIIDVSRPEGTKLLLENLLNSKLYIPLVVGTTGNLPMDLLEEYSKCAPTAISSNFSKGIDQFKKLINSIDKSLWSASITETHHIHKVDKPSGTALTLTKEYGNTLNDVISIREGEVIGKHELLLDSENESIIITHIAKSRNLFAEGALRWLSFVMNKSNGLFYDI